MLGNKKHHVEYSEPMSISNVQPWGGSPVIYQSGSNVLPYAPPPLSHKNRDRYLHVKTAEGARIAIPKNWVINWQECEEGMLILYLQKPTDGGYASVEMMQVRADYDYVKDEINAHQQSEY